MKKLSLLFAGLLFVTLSIGCGSDEVVEVIDLNRVLDVITATLDELKDTSVEGVENNTEGAAKTLPEKDLKLFLEHFEKNLNAANLLSVPIGASMSKSGAITGFTDEDQNSIRDGSDQLLFTIEMDEKGQRLIARDVQNNYYRDTHYSSGGGMGGFFTGYLIGSMLMGQRSMGYPPSRYSNMKMSSPNYHKSAVSKARSSARSSGGSRSFKSGK
ncbi:hypothetical protein QUF75_07325 [Desulfococcaceae bacterium HSG7]|nr:hypothetical protein [Desulfococcaceae bacterium HSG9]MDM8554526.1 hypothetical protein [Desulfococcaceae bacterium HSG7]